MPTYLSLPSSASIVISQKDPVAPRTKRELADGVLARASRESIGMDQPSELCR